MLDRHNARRQAEDFRAGQLCAITANCAAPRKGRPYGPHDFFSSLPKPDQQQSPQEMLAVIQMINAMQNARQ